MELSSLKAFLVVADTESFSEAAKALFLTQPAVSKRIQNLEEEFGEPIFNRMGRKVSLTEAGELLYPKAQSIVEQIDALKPEIKHRHAAISGKLRMGISHHIGLHRLPPVLKEYAHKYPHVTLDIYFVDSEEAFEKVLQGRIELGVVTLPPDLIPPPLITEKTWSDPLAFMMATPEKSKTRLPSSLEALSEIPALLPSKTTFTRKIVEQVFFEQNLNIEVAMSTNNLESIKMMTRIGLGWTVLPLTMKTSELTTLKMPSPISRDLGIVTHGQRTLSRAARKMVELIREHKDI